MTDVENPASSTPPSGSDSDADASDIESFEKRPMLSAFDSISSSSPPSSTLLAAIKSSQLVKACCLSHGCRCERVGSSRIWNTAIYRSHKLCITGPHFPATVFITIFIIAATYFFGFVAPMTTGAAIASKAAGNPAPSHALHTLICITFSILCNVLLYMTACIDPGIVKGPTSLPPAVANDPALRRTWRFCDKCQIYQGPKTAHCSDCKVCIDELDHHCPWMSKCVGKKNMIWFKYFNLSWVVYFAYVIIALFYN